MSYSYNRPRRRTIPKTARVNAQVLSPLNDLANDFEAVYHDTVRNIIHLGDAQEQKETYGVLKEMIELEIDEHQKRLRQLEKVVKAK